MMPKFGKPFPLLRFQASAHKTYHYKTNLIKKPFRLITVPKYQPTKSKPGRDCMKKRRAMQIWRPTKRHQHG